MKTAAVLRQEIEHTGAAPGIADDPGPAVKNVTATVKSALRVFEILEFFAAEQTPRKAVSVARTLRYPISSTAALLKSMTATGFLAFDRRSRTYFPTLRLSDLAARLHPIAVSRTIATSRK